MRSVGDKEFLGFISFFDGFDGEFGKEIGDKSYADFDGNARND